MTQHEYVFVAISIILGLAITRALHTVAMLTRVHRQVTFHWSTALWAICVMTYSLQFWWVGWGFRNIDAWQFSDFGILTVGAICVYGATEMALPVPEGDLDLDFLEHSQGLGRLSALSMLVYFLIGPYVNIFMLGNEVLPSLVVPFVGTLLMGLIIGIPRAFAPLSAIFGVFTLFILIGTV
ncbi:MAG: hypothetical protein V7696_17875 [Halioglobus sp.]